MAAMRLSLFLFLFYKSTVGNKTLLLPRVLAMSPPGRMNIWLTWVLSVLPQEGECLFVCLAQSFRGPYSTNLKAYEANMYIFTCHLSSVSSSGRFVYILKVHSSGPLGFHIFCLDLEYF